MESLIIILVIIGLPLLLGIILYNRLVALRQTRRNAFSDIDVQLQQRFDLIPNLVETVKAYASHEQQTLQDVTDARARVARAGNENERIVAEGALGGALMSLFAVAENYPELKADANFRQLQAELSDIENKIAAARRFFNNATNELNTAVEQFPSSVIAKMFGFHGESFFELDETRVSEIRTAPKISFE